jgi:c-di-GMP-binding flagellar brake protein YcgR
MEDMPLPSSNPWPPTTTRSAVRVMVQLDATVDDGQMARMYQTQNLSQTGMLLRTRQPLPVGTDVAVQFLFPGDPMLSRTSLPGGYGFIEGKARVVRHTHPAKERVRGMALQFEELERSGTERLSLFLQAQQLRGNLQTP